MRKLWQDIQAHKRAAMLFLVYWLATLAVIFITWDQGIPNPVVLLLSTLPLIVGILEGLWRSSKTEQMVRFGGKIGGGMLAGLLCTGITVLVMRGGIINELIGWILGWGARWGEMLVFAIVFGVFGIILGFIGAAIASIPEHFHNRQTRD